MTNKIRKVVIPAAGFGTRFLAATKAMPKEMLPIVDKPIIQYVVEEAVASGIRDVIIVTGWHKRSIEDHFDYPFELEKRLEEAGKHDEVEKVRRIAELANFVYIRQKGTYGNGTPVLNAKNVIGDEPFAVLWGDEFFDANPPRLKQMIDVWEKYHVPVLSGARIHDRNAVSRYGIVDMEPVDDNVYRIKKIIEKPKPDEAPSNLATLGGYILPPRIFDLLAQQQPGRGGEIWLAEAINELMKEQDVYVVDIKDGKYYDTGNKLEYLKAIVEFGLKHNELREDFTKYLQELS